MIQFTEVTVLFAVTFLMIVTCYGHNENEEPSEEQKRSSDHIPRVTVQLKCSQDSSDVLCTFCFTNNGGEDVYLMKRNTPLEGLSSNFLNIKHDGQNHVKYEGQCCFKRVPITKDDYILLPVGHTISTSIEVNRAYKFSHDGSYTIQYTGPLVYLTKDRMDILSQENEQLTELGCSQSRDTALASTQIKLEDVSNFRNYLVVGGAAVVGGVGAVVAAPLVVGALGFGAGGIAAGSFGAYMMSWSAPTAATGVVAGLQSIGAAGMGAAATTVVAGTGAVVGAGAAVVGQVIVDAVVSPCDQDKSPDLNMKIDTDCEEMSDNDFYEMSNCDCNETSDNK